MTGLGRPVDSAIFSHPRAQAAIRARRFGVTPSMIEAVALRRAAGDWRGACAAAAVEVQIDPSSLKARHGSDLAELILDDLRNLSPDLLRWHFPRARHGSGLLLEDEWVPLADYAWAGVPVTLVAASPRHALAAGQRIALTVLAGSRRRDGTQGPSRRSLTHHRMFWDAAAAPQLARLSADLGGGGTGEPGDARRISALQDAGRAEQAWAAAGIELICAPARVSGRRQQANRISRLATLPVNLPLLVTQARETLPGVDRGAIAFRGGALVLRGLGSDGGPVTAEVVSPEQARDLPALPDAAWLRPVDAELLRLDLLAPPDLHPLVADALAPRTSPTSPNQGPATGTLLYRTVPYFEAVEACDGAGPGDGDGDGAASQLVLLVRCGTNLHRVAWRDGRWQAEHDEHGARELLLNRLGGAMDPCRQAAEYLGTGRHILDLVESLLEHGRIHEVLRLLPEHADAGADPLSFALSDGTTVGESLEALFLRTAYLRARAGEAEPPAAVSYRLANPSLRRRPRKGEPARTRKR
ncbi:hypothetical protein KDL01_35610 [Actinospica durhamensis]|uniref:Uncharacterized protein n=1 Tax=Actinospica durhamensis TaxID=1508375 RepID=A0A941IRC5_9ACTN|nr:hypothetical protein [Actinospica durhamensis]MBR7838650.1 hypothetical protein [Actinospica durhamensis]